MTPHSDASTLRLAVRTMAALFGLLIVVGWAQPVLAHATLIETVPADGAQLDESPPEVIVRFDEEVDLSVSPARVFDASGERRDDGTAGHGDDRREIRLPLPPLSDGAYVVTWRAVSEDGHPIHGAFVFRVGDGEAELSGDLISALLGDEGGRWAALFGAILRAVAYGATLVAAGAFLFSVLVTRGPTPATTRLVSIAAPVGIVASLGQIPIFAFESTGLGLAALGSFTALTDAVSSSVGVAALIRVYALSMLWLVARRAKVWAGAVGVVLVVVAEAFTGHTRTTDPLWATITSDVVHVGAAALWVGGLLALFVLLRSESDAPRMAAVVGRFSTSAAWSLLLLATAGVVLAWTQVRTVAALTSTAYGWSLIAKVAVVLGVGAVAAYNRRVLVPSIEAEEAPEPLARLRRTTSLELAGLTVVVAITAFLVNIEPAAQAAGVTGPYSTYVAFGDDQLNLVVDPNRTGVNEIHLYVLTPAGLPGLASGDAEIELSLPAEDIGPIVRELQVAGPGHYVHVGPELALPGEWVVTVRERMSQFDIRSVDVPVTVSR